MNNLCKIIVMKKKIVLICVLFLMIGSSVAQERGPRLTKAEIINKKWTFIVEKSGLTPADIQKIEPLFMETELELWDLLEKNRELYRQNRRKADKSAINYEAINDGMVNFELDNARIQQKYYLKLKKILSAQTINRMLMAEKSYKRELMQRVSGQQRGFGRQE